MGISLSGLAFRSDLADTEVVALVDRLTGQTAIEIAPPMRGEFDIRDHTDVMVLRYADACFVCNGDIAWPLGADSAHDARPVFDALGRPAVFMAFCNYESGDSYGYAVFEHGRRTRSRWQTSDAEGEPDVQEFGAPTALENRWLQAPFDVETDPDDPEWREKVFYRADRRTRVPEFWLTRQMLDEALVARFGVCPWNTLEEPVRHCIRLTPRS
jgi:hypothetical protein